MTSPSTLAPGHIDIHAHLLPEDCYEIPAADGVRRLAERADDELHLGDFPIAVTRDQISGVPRILADMDAEDIAVRVVSAPPYAFAVSAEPDAAADYARRVNEGLMRMCENAPDRLVPLGVLPFQDRSATAIEVKRLVADGVRGVSVPPVVGSFTLGDPELHHVLDSCAEAGLAVLVHPTQQPRPGFNHHYLQNLIGNPVESATAIASILLGGTFDRAPALRIAFVHGAGVAPALLGRWDYGWRMRADVSADSATAPSEVFRNHVYADSLAHSVEAGRLLCATVHPERITLGSDYPFDMADAHPVRSAEALGLDQDALRTNALRWLAW
ncbi:amidohydrolase family protein [Mycolicibacterium litorale]|uniref:2-hydroxy-3-carboxy-6-oxo-7-methylocta-2,4-dienoa te decarboxylase n=1 Tax=Mycolicibacterium litorale TaxID=758802 RepID=A0AAD1IIA0_9MYCO|nr:amidohydrolase family protein [Mycolicibacterium litorale]MCV7418833.1 amidohydrolase family protein [Mycolicibacterium litorale]TDY00383.1 aminocarboxymuconate-semialdehyde decarboxylase [Mycolicibacterium litorale]BBY15784.1 2-hydroxy-3-carboxy-6-oxo-7-methylocta-2,4-dienoa te decarboxylase [Mycolicibacterium litorale]